MWALCTIIHKGCQTDLIGLSGLKPVLFKMIVLSHIVSVIWYPKTRRKEKKKTPHGGIG